MVTKSDTYTHKVIVADGATEFLARIIDNCVQKRFHELSASNGAQMDDDGKLLTQDVAALMQAWQVWYHVVFAGVRRCFV